MSFRVLLPPLVTFIQGYSTTSRALRISMSRTQKGRIEEFRGCIPEGGMTSYLRSYPWYF